MKIQILFTACVCSLLSAPAYADVCSDRATASGILSNTFNSGASGTATFRARAGAKDGQLSGSFQLTDTTGTDIRSTRITRYFFNSATSRGVEYEAVINGTNGFVMVNFYDNGDTGDFFDVQLRAPGFSYGAAGPVNEGSVVVEPAVDCTSCISSPFFIAGWWTGDHHGQDVWSTNDARLENGAHTVQGLVDKAFSFDGVNDFTVVPASSAIDVAASGAFTIELWINPAALTGSQVLAAWRTDADQVGVELRVMSDGSLFADFVSGVGLGIISAPGIISTGTWQHVAFTWSSSSGDAALYVNGDVVAQQNFVGLVPETAGSLYFGGLPTGSNYQGLMDELTLYTRNLVPGQIQAIYQAGASGKCKPQ